MTALQAIAWRVVGRLREGAKADRRSAHTSLYPETAEKYREWARKKVAKEVRIASRFLDSCDYCCEPINPHEGECESEACQRAAQQDEAEGRAFDVWHDNKKYGDRP